MTWATTRYDPNSPGEGWVLFFGPLLEMALDILVAVAIAAVVTFVVVGIVSVFVAHFRRSGELR